MSAAAASTQSVTEQGIARGAPAERRWISAVGLLLVLYFLGVAFTRYIDGDEGYLLYAARLLAEGEDLYTDFFCPQAPLVPTLFSYWYRVFGSNWYSARVLAAIIAAGTGLLVLVTTRHHSRSFWVPTLATFLFAGSGYAFGWLPIVKTYGLAVLCSMAAVYLLERGGRLSMFLGGFLIILAAEARLYVGIIGVNAVVFAVRRRWMARQSPRAWVRPALVDVSGLAFGAICGLALMVPPFVRDFETAYFGIFEFASVRFPEQTTLFGPLQQKIDVLLMELSVVGNDGASSPQLLGLVFLGMVAWILPGLPGNRMTASVWPTLLVVNLLPYNTFVQYVAIVVPFVAVEAALVLERLDGRETRRRFLAVFLLGYTWMGALELNRYCWTGRVMGPHPDPPAWRLGRVEEVARAIDTYEADSVVSWWPGYFVSSKTRVIPELANHFGFHVTERYEEDRLQRLTLISEKQLAAGIAERRYQLIVYGNWTFGRLGPQIEAAYRPDQILGNVTFWLPKEPDAPSSR